MKKEFAVLSVFFALIVACGDETTIENVTRAGMDVVASADDLPECTDENEGEYAFVKDDEETRICVGGKWKPAAVSDAGNGSFSCKTEELEDRSGLKIVCNGDSIGVVLNGVNGADGKPGESGNDGAPGTSCSIKDRSDAAVVIACGDSTITIDLKLNQPQDTAKVDSEQVSVFLDSLVGYAQKGPFLKGSTVYLYELSDGQSLKPVSGPLTGTVMRDDGYFKFPARNFASRYALVAVEGNYRNEVSGKNSDSPIRLNALVDLSNRDSVNVNVLTHLEYERVHHLVTRENYTMGKAKQKAQQEILKLFHIELDSVPSAEDMNIFGSTDADAALLAVSILLQGDSSSLALSALLNEISNGISETGKWTGPRSDSLFAALAEWALFTDFFIGLEDYYYQSSSLDVIRLTILEWKQGESVSDFEKHIRRFFSVESGLGVCGSDSVSVGVVKNVSNRFLKTYYASDYTDVSNSKARFICKERNGLKNWQPAKDIEMDTLSFGHVYAEGQVKNGLVNVDLPYVFENGNWRHGTPYDTIVNIGCIQARKDTVAQGIDGTWYKCVVDTNMVYRRDGGVLWSRCSGSTNWEDCIYGPIETKWTSAWRIAENIEMDTATWGHNYNEGDVRNGNVNTTLPYVYQDGNWRTGTELDSLIVKAGGRACLTDGDIIKYSDLYYMCIPQTSGDVVRKWVLQSDVFNDTYEERDECSATGKYGDGTLLNGRVNTDKVYVCDNGEFRQAETIEINGGKGCTTYNRGEYYVLEKDVNGNKQYSFYKCMDGGWMFAFDKLNRDEITDTRNGKKYKTVAIKTQIWMAENMDIDYKVKPLDSDSVVYGSYTYSGCENCGHYYTWAAAMDSAGVFSTNASGCGYGSTCSAEPPVQGICPEGWHLPSMDEWEILINAMGGNSEAGLVLKSQQGWGADGAGSDAYGFSALPAGMRFVGGDSFFNEEDGEDYFILVGEYTYFWGAAKSGAAGVGLCAFDNVFSLDTDEVYAHSVRCLKDPD